MNLETTEDWLILLLITQKNKPEVKLVIDENKAKDLGLTNQSIGKSIETLYSGKNVTTLNEAGKEYPIILQADIKDRRNTETLSKIEDLKQQES